MNSLANNIKDTMPDFPVSVNGNQWQVDDYDNATALAISQRFSIPDIVARIMVSRDIYLDDAESFLNPSLQNSLPDPSHLKDMDKAVDRIIEALNNYKKNNYKKNNAKNVNIAVFGDYDVDGATSTSVLKRYFKMLSVDINTYIPDRINEGYGPNTEALLKLREQGAELCITVDCGTVSFEPFAEAKKAGLDIIVMDHHLGNASLPEAVAVVNPNRIDEESPHRNLAAVGVCFLFIVAINRALRQQGWFKDIKEPNILSLLDLVALGTVCDVMTLTNLNRVFVSQGLKVMAKRHNLGLKTLSDIAGLDTKPKSYHLGFVIGPRINACGRIGIADFGTKLLTTNNAEEAKRIGDKLNILNAERKAIEQVILDEAMLQAEKQQHDQAVIMVAKEGWHSGVIGIVASRIKERFGKPTAVISLENGVGKASARSISGVDLGSVVTSAKMDGLLVAGGGHSMAAGFTIEENKLEDFRKYLNENLMDIVTEKSANKVLKLNAVLGISSVSAHLVDKLSLLEPYGNGNPEPRFVITNAKVQMVKIVGQGGHIMVMLQDGGAVSSSSKKCKAMCFRAVDTPLGDALMAAKGKVIHVAGKIKINDWNGNRQAELFIDDICLT